MKEKIMDLLKSTAISIGIAMALFCLSGIAFDIRDGGSFSLENYQFTKMVAGCVLIGMGFGIPTIVYQNEKLPLPIRVIIHMGIGCTVYTIVAYAVGWMGGAATIGKGILIGAIHLGLAFVIWLLFMCYYRHEAKRINDRIQEIK